MSAPLELVADCSACEGLCCVAPTFARSADFAFDKPAGTPCPHLAGDATCSVHSSLRSRGMVGCTTYDCFGAGQRVVRGFAGRSWRDSPATARAVFASYAVVRDLHELLWCLTDALGRPGAAAVHADLAQAYDEVARLADGTPDELAEVDVDALRARVGPLLRAASRLVRSGVRRTPVDHARSDLSGARLAGTDLRAADLRSTLLLGADLSGADLRLADLLGADLRGARLDGADLRDALFLSQTQVNAARGDAATRLSPGLARPAHWTRGA